MNALRFTCQRSRAKVIELFCTVNPDDVMNLLFTRKFNETLIFVHTCTASDNKTQENKLLLVRSSACCALLSKKTGGGGGGGADQVSDIQRHKIRFNSAF